MSVDDDDVLVAVEAGFGGLVEANVITFHSIFRYCLPVPYDLDLALLHWIQSTTANTAKSIVEGATRTVAVVEQLNPPLGTIFHSNNFDIDPKDK